LLRAQTSIEALLVLAAFLALFAALAPFYSRIASASTLASFAVQEKAFCDELAAKARDAHLMPGSRFSFNLSAPANASVYFAESTQELCCNFSKGRNFSRYLGFPVLVSAQRAQRFSALVSNPGSVEVSLIPADQ
jgi:hypothetical protein